MTATIAAALDTTTIRPLREADVPAADGVMRDAFGTFIGLPEPRAFLGDASLVAPRARLLRDSAWVAERDGEIVGSNFATRWGGFAFFGPLSVRPDLWESGVGQRLMEPVLARIAEWDVAHAGLFTWPHSPKHLALYQRYGYWPHALTAVMARPVRGGGGFDRLSQTPDALERCSEVAHAVHEGLDLTAEAQGTLAHGLGEVVLVDGGFAVCQHGAGTEAGGGALFVKFGAVAPGAAAPARFARLVAACDAYAAQVGAQVVLAGVSTARQEAYRALLDAGFRIEILGLAMHRDARPLWSRPGCWVIDDWR